MSYNKRKYSSGKSNRGNLIAIGVQRKLFVMMAMLAAFATLITGSLISVNAFADGEKTYIITYTMPDGDSVNVSETHGGLPSQTVIPDGDTVTFSTMPTTTRKGLTFRAWRYSTGISSFYEPSGGSFTAPVTQFKREGSTDTYVLNLTPYWNQPCRVAYISEGSVFHSNEFTIEAGGTSHNSVFSTKPVHSESDKFAFVGWVLDSTGNGSREIAWSQLPYTTEKFEQFSWFDTSTGCSTFNETDNVWQVNLYAVWTKKIAVTYIDQEVNYSNIEKVDPQGFRLPSRDNLLTAEKNAGNRPATYPDYDLYKNVYRLVWNTSSDFTGTSYTNSQTEFRSDITLYAQWNIEYEVDYYIKKNDGTYPSSQNFIDTFQLEKSTPKTNTYSFVNKNTKTGYEITSWSVEPGGSGSSTIALSAFSTDYNNTNKRAMLRVYGEWTPRTYAFVYEVNYDIDGSRSDHIDTEISGLPAGIDADNTLRMTFDNLTGGYPLSPLSASGYRFEGWYIYYRLSDAPDGISKGTDFAVPANWITDSINQTIHLRARWHKYNSYSLTYDLNIAALTDGAYIGQYTGDAAPANVSFTEDQFDTVFEDGVYHAAMGTNMKAAGYRFGGWKVSRSRYDGGQTLIVDYTDTSQSTFSIPKSNFTEADDGELTATAIWTPYFAVKYDNNTPTDDVTGMPERTDLTGSYSGTKVFDATNPTRDHYHFRGWSYLSGDNLNAVISHNSSPNDLRPHIPVTAFSNVQGSTNTVEAKYTEDDQGYFELTVYAVWEPMTVYTLTYDQVSYTAKKDGENYTLPAAYQPERFAKDKEVTVKDDLPDIEGYTFSGWQIQSPEGLEISNGTFTMPQNDVVLFGEYTKNSYNVIYEAYDVDGNEISLDPAVYGDAEYFNGDEVTVAPVLTDEEYTFDGWKVKSPANLAVIQSAGGEKTFTMPESNVVLTGRFIDPTAEVVYTITYRSGVNEGDDGYTEDLGKAPEFDVTADADGNATHKVLANNAPELKYVREGYTFAGWKLTKAQPDPNPAPGGKGTVVAPRAYAPNGLIGGGEVITVDSSVVLTAQWTKNVPSPDGEKTPGTGESSVPIVIAFNLAIISLLATGVILRRRRAS